MAEFIGVIAEDETDVATMRVLVNRLSGRPVKGQSGNGCAQLRKKASAWMRELYGQGVTQIVLVHDLDRDGVTGELNDEAALRRRLAQIDVPAGVHPLICIPVEELEAWFWSSDAALTEVARKPQVGHKNPHLIARPKEELARLSRTDGKKARYSTNENPKLAGLIDLEVCAARCDAFRRLRDFVTE